MHIASLIPVEYRVRQYKKEKIYTPDFYHENLASEGRQNKGKARFFEGDGEVGCEVGRKVWGSCAIGLYIEWLRTMLMGQDWRKYVYFFAV